MVNDNWCVGQKEIADYISVSKCECCRLCKHDDNFPSRYYSGKYRALKSELDDWMIKQPNSK